MQRKPFLSCELLLDNQDSSSSSLVERLEREKIAENERIKGNEFVKAKEYSAAVGCYTRSIELNNKEDPGSFLLLK